MRRVVTRTLLEGLALIMLGTVAGLAANAASDNGIPLGKDHLRRTRPTPTPASISNVGDAAATPSPAAPKPFQSIEHDAVVDIFEGESYQIDLEVFIDARDDDHYFDGHIPGAYQLDHYRGERYLPELVPICQNALRVVLYCNGGECEDSKLASEDLMLEGIDPTKLYVYEGGIAEWRSAGLPIEVGERLSGELTQGK